MPRPAHRALIAVPVLVLAALALTGCGSSSSGSAGATTSPTSTATGTTKAPDKVITVSLVGSKVTPAPGRVKVNKGETVQINVTRDTDGEIHVHGYDIEKQATAGVPVSITFVADQQGVFEVEAHNPDRLLFQLEVD